MQPVEDSPQLKGSPASIVFVAHEKRQSVDSGGSKDKWNIPATPSSSLPQQKGLGAATGLDSAGDLEIDEWLDAYSKGAIGGNESAPKPPRAIAELLQAKLQTGRDRPTSQLDPTDTETDTEIHVLPSGSSGSLSFSGSPDAAAALDFFAKNGHLVAPKMPFEAERLKLTRKYGLDRPRRRAAIDSICRLAQRTFKIPTVVISLTFEDDQVLGGEVGFATVEPGPKEPPRRLGLEPAFCTHALVAATEPAKTFIVRDAKEDWRFKNSPLVDKENGISFYAAANVHLPTDLLESESRALPKSLPVGALCLIDSKPRDVSDFGAEDRETLQHFAGLIARELILGYEQDQRRMAETQGTVLERFLHSALILAETSTANHEDFAATRRASQTTEADKVKSPTSPNRNRVHASPATAAAFDEAPVPISDATKTYDYATAQLVELTPATSAAIMDLRVSHSARKGVARQRNGATFERSIDVRGRIRLLSSCGDIDWTSIVDGDYLSDAVSAVLCQHDDQKTDAATLQPTNQLVSILPSDVQATLTLPVFDVDGSPALLIVMTSSEKHSTFGSPDIRFARNVGAVVVAFLLRQRAMEADRAKLAFVASVSHELRTPLHGINSQVELIREYSTPNQLRRIAPLLDCADVCLESLRDVLDDTLEFAKLSQHASPAEAREAHANALVEADLEQIAEEVLKAVWVRKRRVDLVKDDTSFIGQQVSQAPDAARVDLVLETHRREGGWKAWVDVGGLKRCLLNLVGNALKFTTSGHVKLILRESPPRPPIMLEGEQPTVVFEVEDTGCGMDEAFASKAFLPFVQANSFADGAGLGLSIVASIIQRMSGTVEVRSQLGEGTVVTFALPITFGSPSEPVARLSAPCTDSGLFCRRVISDELTALFTPGSPLSLIGSPAMDSNLSTGQSVDQSTHASVAGGAARLDFGRAIEAAHSSNHKLLNMPSRRKDEPVSLSAVEPSELAVQAAKLSLSTALASKSNVKGLPVAVEASNASTDGDSIPGSPVGPLLTKAIRVLVADDNRIALNILAKLFSAKKIAFQAVENGQEAVDAYKAGGGSFNLVLADVQMPIKDGVEASFEIREHEQAMGWPRCRIVAVTGLSNEVDMRAAGVIDNDGPIDAWIVKGKSLRVLLDEVYRVQDELGRVATGKSTTVDG